MTWNTFHSESERLASEAEARLAHGDRASGRSLYRRAAEAEERALDALDLTKVRTRGITGVSAVSLWLKAGEPAQVTRLGERLLADETLPRFAAVQIREMVDGASQEAGAESHVYEVEVTFRQTLRYAVEASSRETAETEAVELWRIGRADAPAPEGSELVDVHAVRCVEPG